MQIKKTTGFTLIELMIVIAIMGILAAIVYPSYQASIQKSRRADAKGALTQFAGAMERRFTVANSYCDVGGLNGTGAAISNCGTGTKDTGTSTIFATCSPVDVTLVPTGSTCDTTTSTVYYKLTISAVSPTSFTLSATPIKQQATDKCGTLTLTNTGVRDASDNVANNCW